MCNAYNTHCFCSVLKNNVYFLFCKCLNELLLVHLELSQCNINIENCCFLCYIHKHTNRPVIACNLILKHFSHLMRLHFVHDLKRSIIINTIEWIYKCGSLKRYKSVYWINVESFDSKLQLLSISDQVKWTARHPDKQTKHNTFHKQIFDPDYFSLFEFIFLKLDRNY